MDHGLEREREKGTATSCANQSNKIEFLNLGSRREDIQDPLVDVSVWDHP